jgi:hypothetical protein
MSETNVGNAYVITWRYSDGSGSGVVGYAFLSKDSADRWMQGLKDYGDTMKEFKLSQVTIIS